jgi:hypothetical protein
MQPIGSQEREKKEKKTSAYQSLLLSSFADTADSRVSFSFRRLMCYSLLFFDTTTLLFLYDIVAGWLKAKVHDYYILMDPDPVTKFSIACLRATAFIHFSLLSCILTVLIGFFRSFFHCILISTKKAC